MPHNLNQPQGNKPHVRPPVFQDRELTKIKQALQEANNNKAAATPRISEVRNVVKAALASLDACPVKKEYYPTSAPLLTASGSEISIGCYASTCAMYVTCAQDHQTSSGRLLARVAKILSSATSMQQEVAAQCSGAGVPDAMKTYYRKSFAAYESEAVGTSKKFDGIITEIKRLLDGYPSCRDHGNVTGWQ